MALPKPERLGQTEKTQDSRAGSLKVLRPEVVMLELALHACVVVTPDTDQRAIIAAIDRARQQAPVLALLGGA